MWPSWRNYREDKKSQQPTMESDNERPSKRTKEFHGATPSGVVPSVEREGLPGGCSMKETTVEGIKGARLELLSHAPPVGLELKNFAVCVRP